MWAAGIAIHPHGKIQVAGVGRVVVDSRSPEVVTTRQVANQVDAIRVLVLGRISDAAVEDGPVLGMGGEWDSQGGDDGRHGAQRGES